jgi:hypothetical protein
VERIRATADPSRRSRNLTMCPVCQPSLPNTLPVQWHFAIPLWVSRKHANGGSNCWRVQRWSVNTNRFGRHSCSANRGKRKMTIRRWSTSARPAIWRSAALPTQLVWPRRRWDWRRASNYGVKNFSARLNCISNNTPPVIIPQCNRCKLQLHARSREATSNWRPSQKQKAREASLSRICFRPMVPLTTQ